MGRIVARERIHRDIQIVGGNIAFVPQFTQEGMSMSETKACPYCGEQILAVAMKCKHCGSMLGGQPSAAVSAVTNQFKMRPGFVVAAVVILGIFGAAWGYNWTQTGSMSGNGFTDADIANVTQSIRAEFSKRAGVTVQDVQMLRESPRRLEGFVKIKVPLIGTVDKSCTATMGDDGRSIWQCGS
jgi:hypothetical protein